MPTELPSPNLSLEGALREIAELRRWAGPAKEFWPRLLLALAGLSHASKAVILLADNAQPGKWKRIGDWSSNVGAAQPLVDFTAKVEAIAQQCATAGDMAAPLNERRDGHYTAAFRLKLQRAEDVCVAVLLLSGINEAAVREALLRLTLVADVPASYQGNLASAQAKSDVEKFAATLDLMVLINA